MPLIFDTGVQILTWIFNLNWLFLETSILSRQLTCVASTQIAGKFSKCNSALLNGGAPINSKLWHPPPGQTLGIWLLSSPGEWGIWPSPRQGGGGNWTESGRFQMVFLWRWRIPTTAPSDKFDYWVRAFEHSFGPRGREFERSNLQKFKCSGFTRGGGGGDVEVSSWSAHNH